MWSDLPQQEDRGLMHTQRPVLEVLEQAAWACLTHRAAPSYFFSAATLPLELSIYLPEVNFQKQRPQSWARGMNREGAPGKSPEELYIQQKVRVLLMLRKMGSNLTPSEEEFLRTYAGVVSSQLSQLPQHSIDQGAEDVVMAFARSETEDRRQ